MFDLIAWRWGNDSTEDFNSYEWDKRKNWGAI
jgi:hypothetical protein